MSVLGKLKLLFKLESAEKKAETISKENISVSLKIAHYLLLAASLAGAFGIPTLAGGCLHSHMSVYVIFVAAAIFLHSVLPSIFAAPSAQDLKATGLDKAAILLLVFLLAPAVLHAQTATPAPAPTQISNIYAGGISYNPGASPQIAGSAFYGRLVTPGTFAFTEIDALPQQVKPFTVSTNVGGGAGTKVYTFKSVPIYSAAGTGISWTGSNTGWNWNGGVLASIPFPKLCASCYLMPNVRFLKSSVGGDGYQPIVGLWIGLGK